MKAISTRCSTPNLFPPQYRTCEKAHGRLDVRSIWTSTALNGYINFPHCRQVACVDRVSTNIKSGKTRHEQVGIITSLTPEQAPPKRLLEIVRGHWTIENRSHWVRDVTFDEDRSQVRSGHAPRVMAILRNLVIGILRLLGVRYIPTGLRRFARRPQLALGLLGL